MMNKSKTSLALCLLTVVFLNAYAQDSRIRRIQEISWKGEHQQALDEYGKILSKEPGNLDALEGKGDVLSWMDNLSGSVKAYDEYLERRFSQEVARKRARVLAWDQRFSESLEAYQFAYDNSKNEAIKQEMLGKKAWWDAHTLTSMEHYREALRLEPDNLEARSDLAQVESYERLVDEATEDFGYITQRHPWHFRAAEGLKELGMAYGRVSFRPQFSWFNSISADRFTEIRRFYSELMFQAPFYDNYDLLLGYALDNFNYSGSSSITRNYGLVGLRASLNARMWVSGLYGHTFGTSDGVVSQRYNTKLSIKPFEPVILSIFSQREDLINNKFVLTNGIHSTDVGASVRVNINRHTASVIEYRRGFVNDSNRVNWASLEQIFIFMPAPTELTLTGKFQFQDWKITRNDYFSPQHFWSVPVTLRWRHYVNEHGMYYGARDTYYGFRYQFQVDRGKVIFNGLGAEFHHDFTQSMALHYDVFGNYSDVYKDFGMSLGLVGYF